MPQRLLRYTLNNVHAFFLHATVDARSYKVLCHTEKGELWHNKLGGYSVHEVPTQVPNRPTSESLIQGGPLDVKEV